MNQTVRKVLLVVIMSLIILLLLLGASYAFFEEEVPTGAESPVVVSSCAGVKFSDNDTNSINLTNTIPMSEIKGMQTTPYSFTVSTNCDSLVGFNLYFVPIEGNTIDVSKIRYAIKLIVDNNSKALGEPIFVKGGLLSELSDASADFSIDELNQLKSSINSNYLSVNKVLEGYLPYKGNVIYELYLWIDENAGNEVMNKTFSMAVTIKSVDREELAHEKISNLFISKYIETGNIDEAFKQTGLYYHDVSLENSAKDMSYRYAGSNPNNYVCFGDTCSDDELYRIIGVTGDRLKLIKYTPIGEKTWSLTTNNWSSSNLNAELNGTYLNSLSFKDYISSVPWILTSCTYANCRDNILPADIYNNEIFNANLSNIYQGKIGLLYLSDLAYGAANNQWQTMLYNTTSTIAPYDDYRNQNFRQNNWLMSSSAMWTMSAVGDTTNYVYDTGIDGTLYASLVSEYKTVYPVFYLNNDVKILKGIGAKNTPYIIK